MLIEQFASSGEPDAFPYVNETEFEFIYGLYAQQDKRVLARGTVPQENFAENYSRISKDELEFVNPEAFADDGIPYYENDYILVPTKIADFYSALEAYSLCASICESETLCTAGFQFDEVSTPSLGLTYGCVSSCYFTDVLPHQDETHLTSPRALTTDILQEGETWCRHRPTRGDQPGRGLLEVHALPQGSKRILERRILPMRCAWRDRF